MRFVAFLSALFGVVVGLLFGVLLWGEAKALPAAPAGGGRAETELLDTLRDIRALLQHPPAGSRFTAAAEPAPSAQAQPEPLTAATAHSAEELRLALDEAVAALHRVAAEGGGGFSGQAVSADASATLNALIEPGGKGKSLGIFGSSPRDVHARFGTPGMVGSQDGSVIWTYLLDPDGHRQVQVQFTDGYVVSCYGFER